MIRDNKDVIMLILTRKIGESIIIGDDISLILLDVENNKATLGVKAPKDVDIRRQESYYPIRKRSSQEDAQGNY